MGLKSDADQFGTRDLKPVSGLIQLGNECLWHMDEDGSGWWLHIILEQWEQGNDWSGHQGSTDTNWDYLSVTLVGLRIYIVIFAMRTEGI